MQGQRNWSSQSKTGSYNRQTGFPVSIIGIPKVWNSTNEKENTWKVKYTKIPPKAETPEISSQRLHGIQENLIPNIWH